MVVGVKAAAVIHGVDGVKGRYAGGGGGGVGVVAFLSSRVGPCSDIGSGLAKPRLLQL